MPIAGTIFGVLMLIYLIASKSYLEHYLITTFTLISLVASCNQWHFARTEFNDRMCADNAVNEMQYIGNSTCVVNGIVLHYTILAASAAVLAMAIHFIIKSYGLVNVMKNPQYLLFQFTLVFGLPIIPVIYAADNEYYGFSKTKTYCFVLSKVFITPYQDVALGGLPVFIAYAITYILLFATIFLFKYYPTPAKVAADANPGARTGFLAFCANMEPELMVILFSVLIFVPYIASWGELYAKADDYEEKFYEWVTCVFSNYEGGGSTSYYGVCGEHTDTRPANLGNPWNSFTLFGSMILVAPVFVGFHLLYRHLNPVKDTVTYAEVNKEIEIAPKSQEVAIAEAVPADANAKELAVVEGNNEVANI